MRVVGAIGTVGDKPLVQHAFNEDTDKIPNRPNSAGTKGLFTSQLGTSALSIS